MTFIQVICPKLEKHWADLIFYNNNNNDIYLLSLLITVTTQQQSPSSTRSNRKHTMAPLAAAIRSMCDVGAQLTASWNQLCVLVFAERGKTRGSGEKPLEQSTEPHKLNPLTVRVLPPPLPKDYPNAICFNLVKLCPFMLLCPFAVVFYVVQKF